MSSRILLSVGGVLLAGFIVLLLSTYTVDEAEQAIVLQFGRPVGDPITEPGLHFKVPFIQEVRRFDKRILAWDGDPNQVPTRGREFISIDTTARWRIAEPLEFLKSVRDESGAQSRLDDVIDSVVRDNISGTDLVEFVRSKSWDITAQDLEETLVMAEDDEQRELTRPIEIGRETLTRRILEEARKKMPQYGIDLVDVRIKRLNYIDSVQKQVFERMVSERQRIAEQFRSEGEGEGSRIRGGTAQELAEIRSEAKRKAQVIRGEADAEAARIYNEAYGSSQEFYGFWRKLQSLRETIPGSVLMVDGKAPYFKTLTDGASGFDLGERAGKND